MQYLVPIAGACVHSSLVGKGLLRGAALASGSLQVGTQMGRVDPAIPINPTGCDGTSPTWHSWWRNIDGMAALYCWISGAQRETWTLLRLGAIHNYFFWQKATSFPLELRKLTVGRPCGEWYME